MCSRPSTSSASSATRRPGSCGPATAAPSAWSCWTSRNPFFTDLAAGAEGVAASLGLSVVLCNSNDDTSREHHYLSTLQEQRAFGILITPVGSKTTVIDEIRRRGIPVVLVDRAARGNE